MLLRVAPKLRAGGGAVRSLFYTPVASINITAGRICRTSTSNRPISSSCDDLVLTRLDPSTGIAELTMNNLPVNSLSLEMCQALTKSIEQAEDDPKIQALILQSSSPTIFSAGLDLMEMHNPEPERLNEFWRSFQNLYFALYGSRLACIAAIEGHAPAAGCMLALSCDYRIMAASNKDTKQKPTIGLNESKLGIAAPPWLAQQMIDTVGRRQAEISLSLGTLYSSEEALDIKLVDEVVAKEVLRPRAVEVASEWVAIPAQARVASKQLVRKQRLDTLRASVDQDVEHFVGFITHGSVQKSMSAYLEMLVKKNKKK